MMFVQTLFAQVISVDGTWDFAVDTSARFSSKDVLEKASWRSAQVPLSWQAQFPDLRDYQGVAWYRKTVSMPELHPSEVVLLHFYAVDFIAEVFVNGKYFKKMKGVIHHSNLILANF